MAARLEDLDTAVAAIDDGATVMVGGFGVPGTPFCLLEALRRHGARRLTLIKNDANESGSGVDRLLAGGQVERLVVSHIGLNANAVEMMNRGELEVELCAQGILAERIRNAGAGLYGFVTDIGVDTLLADGKVRVEVDGRLLLLERPLRADFALIHAARADRLGNLVYAAAAQNFNPLMATAAAHVIAEVEQLVEPGEIAAEAVHTPAPFVDALVPLPELTEDYGVVRR